ncbi:uncharacterized protein B0I36DRAFT_353671 [Microdochium trichocladiopsis]|uniref:UspA domain-containing protein n=1 Tax=Microdochium trichocladiopsis TaxID=1682393 RepID=A0A9P9BKT7_9PEZI|nr:uncharacterized protein B0I36DRAFT_353671 [Microdochium trichocladiopsis]KAH7020937.1 hypothetical protein B0I36DRAFT_353671 [Microdochium trichocladiopsis]
MAGRPVSSLEAALEEERAEIENLILQQKARSPPSSISMRSPSPYARIPQSPVRSMLDVGGSDTTRKSPSQAPYRSMLDLDAGSSRRPSSMLDVGEPTSAAPRSPMLPHSTHTSPTLSYKTPILPTARNRSASDASAKPVDFGPRSPPALNPRYDSMSAYQFSNILPTNVGQAHPSRRTQGSSNARSSSIGEALRGTDISSLMIPGEGRSSRFSSRKGNKSKSPSGRFSLRSSSPGGSLLANSAGRSSGGLVLDSNGQVIDMNSAYRRLSDANLLYGGSNLASYARKKPEGEGLGRIEKDNMSPYGDILPSDESDDTGNSSDEEADRGRKLTTRAEEKTGVPQRRVQSLLAAAEEERQHVSTQPQYRSLFDDAETHIARSENKAKAKNGKQPVHPSTSFDEMTPSGNLTPALDPDLEADVSAIRVAQNLALSHTGIISTPEVHRSIKIIYRGEFDRIQREAAEEHRRLRKYLVATDLSDESTHALEWAIGTVLRDGDTLLALYSIDEETASSADPNSINLEDARALKEQAAAVSAIAKGAMGRPPGSNTGSPHALHAIMREARSATPSPAPSMRGKGRLEEERERAVQDITERVSKLLRKTQLQVRVIIEVIHCKSPKHLVTEVIDLVSPTLVIIGSRGRSALKGTLLGSFSNYLVTKSSVPVMVARKRLRKKSKYQAPPAKQINNLANPAARSLETARID